MGRDLVADFAAARLVFEEADERLGFALSTLCFEGPADELALTQNAQPGILATSIATCRVLEEIAGLEASVVAGHSLGEWSALVAAGALDLGDALRGVRERGRLMQDAVPRGIGAMAAVIGLDTATLAALCEEAAGDEVLAPANLNGAGQIVVAGHAGAVDRLMTLARAQNARVQRLDVSAPFHCPLMRPVADGLGRFLAGVTIREPRIPVVSSVEPRTIDGPADITALLVSQVTAPVRWEETMQAVHGFAPARALEVGPGRVLTGLARRLWRDVPCEPVGDVASVRRVRELLQ
jgi:[acyl-carrier-protein] S-malonyltransferase